MKPCNSKHKAFALTKTGAAALITAALLTAVLFTACKQVTGGGGGGGSVPTVNITVTGDTNINLPAEPIAVTAGGTWQKVRSGIESKVSPKPGFVIDSWHLGTDESAPELQDADAFSTDTTVFVASRPDLPDISSIQGTGEQVNITLALTDNSAGSILGQNPVRINKGTAWNSVFQTYADAALKVNYGFQCNGWKKNGTLLDSTFTFDSDTTIFADMEDLRINITVTGDANVSVTDSTPLVVLSGTKWQNIKARAAGKVQVSDPENIAVTAWKLNNESGTTLSDEYEFKKSEGTHRTVFAKTGDRRIRLTVTYGSGSGTPTNAGFLTVYDGEAWFQIEARAKALVSIPEGHSIHWHFNNAAGEPIYPNYQFKASDGNARTVYGRLRQSVELTVTYGRITGGTTTLGPVTVQHGELWDTVRQRIEDANPIIKHTNVQWHWKDKNGQLIDNYYHIDIGNLPSQTVYAFVRPKITEVGSGALTYNTSIDSPFSYEYYGMKDIDAVTNGTVGGYSYGSTANNEHTVSLAAYTMGETEVTQELYELVMAVNPSYFQGSSHQPDSGERQEKRPVEQVNWYDAVAFCNELTCCTLGLGENECVYTYNGKPYTVEDAQAHRVPEMDMSKKGFRLPTEAEWEWAAQGGPARQIFAGTNDKTELSTYAWYKDNSSNKTHQVRKKTANRFDLFDMSGNVYEWCWDWFDYPTPAGGENPVGASSGTKRVIRGGFYADYSISPCRCAYRYRDKPETTDKCIGFRIVRKP